MRSCYFTVPLFMQRGVDVLTPMALTWCRNLFIALLGDLLGVLFERQIGERLLHEFVLQNLI